MLFPSLAHAMGAAPAGGGEGAANPITAFLPLIIMFAIFYFLLIRPQQKKAKQHRAYLANLGRGDYILTGGGIYGRIMEVHGDKLTVEIAKDLTIEINRSFVSGPGEPQAAPAKAEAKGKAKE
ncbi:preprotein translocase subunit YajC [Desulfovibrio sp. JY]|nr:preprotein translocase subunit YajC [Desulfovibrio sp. JY]